MYIYIYIFIHLYRALLHLEHIKMRFTMNLQSFCFLPNSKVLQLLFYFFKKGRGLPLRKCMQCVVAALLKAGEKRLRGHHPDAHRFSLGSAS